MNFQEISNNIHLWFSISKGLAVNSQFIAVATSLGFVRIFTVGGLQYHVFSIPGPVVALSMCETQVMIVYHQATGLYDYQFHF